MRLISIVILAGWAGTAGAATPTPVNDACAAAIPITTLPFFSAEGAIALATTSADDPLPSCTNRHTHDSVWYSFTAPQTMRLNLSTRTSYHDNYIWVGTGACGNLKEIACNDDSAGFFNAQTTFIAQAGQTYTIMLGSVFPVAWGQLGLVAEEADALNPPAPANDMCANAKAITGATATYTTTGVGATEELTDLAPPCWPFADNYTLWYRLTSPVDKQVRIDTTNSTWDTWLTVATGACGS